MMKIKLLRQVDFRLPVLAALLGCVFVAPLLRAEDFNRPHVSYTNDARYLGWYFQASGASTWSLTNHAIYLDNSDPSVQLNDQMLYYTRVPLQSGNWSASVDVREETAGNCAGLAFMVGSGLTNYYQLRLQSGSQQVQILKNSLAGSQLIYSNSAASSEIFNPGNYYTISVWSTNIAQFNWSITNAGTNVNWTSLLTNWGYQVASGSFTDASYTNGYAGMIKNVGDPGADICHFDNFYVREITVPPITQPHPRLQFNGADITSVKADITNKVEPRYSEWLNLKYHADAWITQAPTPPYTGTDSLAFVQQATGGRVFAEVALAYQCTGDAKYSAFAKSNLLAWATATPMPGTTFSGFGDAGMDVARGMIFFYYAYDWIYDTLSPSENAVVTNWFRAMRPVLQEGIDSWNTPLQDSYNELGFVESTDLDEIGFNGNYYQNHLVANTQGMLMLGYVLGDQDLVQFAVDSKDNPRSFLTLFEGVILMAGDPYETGLGTWAAPPPPQQDGEIYDRYRHTQAPGDGIGYSFLAWNQMMAMAETLYANGLNVYTRTGAWGESMEKPFDFYADFWRTCDASIKGGYYTGETIATNASEIAVYEIANRRYPGDPEIQALLNSVNRTTIDFGGDPGLYMCYPLLIQALPQLSWTGQSSTTFDTAGNWQGAMPANNAVTDIGYFKTTPTRQPQLTVSRSIAGLHYDIAGITLSSSGGAVLTLGAAGIGCVVAGTTTNTISAPLKIGADQNWSVAASNTLVSSGVVSGTNSLSKSGSGNVILSGANTYIGATIVSQGVLKAGVASVANISGAFGKNSAVTLANKVGAVLDLAGFNTQLGSLTGGGTTGGNVTLGAGYLAVGGDNTSPQAYAGVISGTGGLVKIGSGTLTLVGTNAYSGVTTISAGKLLISSAQAIANTIVLSANATLGVTAVGAAQLSPASLILNGFSTNEFGAVTSTATAPVNAGSLTINGPVTINVVGGIFAAGQSYPLIHYTSISGAGGFVLGFLPVGVTGTLGTNANSIVLSVSSATVGGTAIWTGNMNGVWDIATLNWRNGGVDATYTDGNIVQFDDTAATTLVNNAPVVSPVSVFVTNNASNYTLGDSPIGGSGSLVKSGSGTLTLSGANTYSGGTTINAGTLVLGTNSVRSGAMVISGPTGTGNVTLADGVTLDNDLNPNPWYVPTLTLLGDITLIGAQRQSVAFKTLNLAGGNRTIHLKPDFILLRQYIGTFAWEGSGRNRWEMGNSLGTMIVTNGSLILDSDLTDNYANFMISSASSFAGNLALTVGSKVFLQTPSQNALGSTGSDTARLTVNGIWSLNGTSSGSAVQTIYSLAGSGRIYESLDLVNSLNARTVTLNGTTGSTEFSGVMSDGPAGGKLALVKGGGNMQILSGLNTYTGGTTISGGTLQLAGGSGNVLADAGSVSLSGGTFDLNSQSETVNNLMVSGNAELIDSGSGNGVLTTTNTGTGNNVSAGVALNLNGGTLKTGLHFVNAGTVNVNGATLRWSSGELLNGLNTGSAGAVVNLNGGCLDGTQAPSGTSGGSLSFGNQPCSYHFNGGVVRVWAFKRRSSGTVDIFFNGVTLQPVANSTTFLPSATFTTGQNLWISTNGVAFDLSGYNGNSFNVTVAGPLQHDTNLLTTADGGLTVTGAGILTLTGTHAYTGPTTVNIGTLLLNGVIGSGPVVVQNGGVLGGSGTINGAVTVGGTLQPGAGGANIATLTINSNLTLAGRVVLALNRNNGQTSTRVSGLKTLTYGGNLTVTNVGSALQNGDSFTLFQATSRTNNFDTLNLPALGSNQTWVWSPTNGTLTVAAVAATPTNLLFSVRSGALTLTWPGSHLGWIAQSNSVNLAATNDWSDIANSQYGTSLGITLNPALTNVFYRLRHP